MTRNTRVGKRLIAAIYSKAAHSLYEPLVVRGTFRLFGGALNEKVFRQGRRAVEVAAGGAILDMPVGTAYFTAEVARAHPGAVVGVDLAEGMVKEASAVARRWGLRNLSVVQADAHRLPFRDESFAAVLCSNGLQVIPGLEETVDELGRVLRTDGTLFVSILSLPLGAVLPRHAASHLPVLLASREAVTAAINAAGLVVTATERTRLAFLVEATKPARGDAGGPASLRRAAAP